MRLIENITDEAHQRHRILFAESEIVLTLRFHSIVQMWTFDAEYKDWSIHGQRIVVDSLHILGQNKPFDFAVIDRSGAGVDPFKLDDFSSGRCELYILDADDMREIRGVPVPL